LWPCYWHSRYALYGPRELHNAARAGDLARVKALVAGGALRHGTRFSGWYASSRRGMGGDLAIVEFCSIRAPIPNARQLESRIYGGSIMQ